MLVVLKAPEQAAAAANTLSQHFRLAATAPQTALASALAFRAGAGRAAPRVPPPAPMRVYAHLGLMLGTVDAQGLAALRADTRQVAQVASAPQLSLIRPVRKARPSRKGWVDISNW